MTRHRGKREHLLTAAQVRAVLSYDSETGHFYWTMCQSTRPLNGRIAGAIATKGYRRIRIGDYTYAAHRLAWLYTYGKWPAKELDHINGVRTDNRIANLREATPAQNVANSRTRFNNASGERGVSWHKRTSLWHARITIEGKTKFLGAFDSKRDAATAYSKAAAVVFGEYAR